MDEAGLEATSGRIGPYEEGKSVQISCEVRGGEFQVEEQASRLEVKEGYYYYTPPPFISPYCCSVLNNVKQRLEPQHHLLPDRTVDSSSPLLILQQPPPPPTCMHAPHYHLPHPHPLPLWLKKPSDEWEGLSHGRATTASRLIASPCTP